MCARYGRTLGGVREQPDLGHMRHQDQEHAPQHLVSRRHPHTWQVARELVQGLLVDHHGQRDDQAVDDEDGEHIHGVYRACGRSTSA